jgi:predicted ATP-dependent protease
MPINKLDPSALNLTIDPDLLGFADTSTLADQSLSWIGQERAEQAAYFGLEMGQPDYNLFVLGETGSGRSSLLRQAMTKVATSKPVPPDLCYVHNFDAPERPITLRMPAGQGDWLRQQLAQFSKYLLQEIPKRLDGDDFKTETERIEKRFKLEEAKAYTELNTFAEKLQFAIQRESGRLVFTLLDESGNVLTENDVLALSKERRAAIDQAEQELRSEIADYLEKIRPLELSRDEALATLHREWVSPLLEQKLAAISDSLTELFVDRDKLKCYLDKVKQNVLNNLDIFWSSGIDEEKYQARLKDLFDHCQVNLVVDNRDLRGAPVLVEENPSFKSLVGSIEYQSIEGSLTTDFTRIRAGSLLRAHGGFLMLHLDDLLADGLVWEKICRLLRSHTLQIEEPWAATVATPVVSIEPEAVELRVKIVLIGSREQYYAIQEENPELARRFRVKVDFASAFLASSRAYRALSIFISHVCQEFSLPHFSVGAVTCVLGACHRVAEDQTRLSANFSHTETLVVESAMQCKARDAQLVETVDVIAARQASMLRHNYPNQCALEAIGDGDVVIVVSGERVGQINGLSLIEMGDEGFGMPVRVTAHSFAGEDGLLNIEREVGLSGPIHDKGVFILQNLLSALFSHDAPLALNASIAFEQEYYGIEGDSASCAELYVLLSALSGLPLKQGIAVTGAVNQYGEILPVGGINEKIEGFFKVCEITGLDGTQGVLIPDRNRRHLMLADTVKEAVSKGEFHIYTAEHMSDGIELLSGIPSGVSIDYELNEMVSYPQDTVLGHVQKTLRSYRAACQQTQQHSKSGYKRVGGRVER